MKSIRKLGAIPSWFVLLFGRVATQIGAGQATRNKILFYVGGGQIRAVCWRFVARVGVWMRLLKESIRKNGTVSRRRECRGYFAGFEGLRGLISVWPSRKPSTGWVYLKGSACPAL